MGEVKLLGSVPVTVSVEINGDGVVSRVVAHIDEFRYERDRYDRPVAESVSSREDVEVAHRIAEAEVWPAWEWGL